jgi:hypothetical protein
VTVKPARWTMWALAAMLGIVVCGCGTSGDQRRMEFLQRVLAAGRLQEGCEKGPTCSPAHVVESIESSIDGRRVALTYLDGHAVVWDLGKRLRLWSSARGGPGVWLAPGGDALVTESGGPDIGPEVFRRMVPPSRTPVDRYVVPAGVDVALTPDGREVLFSPLDGSTIPSSENPSPPVPLVLLGPGGRRIARARFPSPDGSLGPRDAAYVTSRREFVIASVSIPGFYRWRVGGSPHAIKKDCTFPRLYSSASEPLTLSPDGGTFACLLPSRNPSSLGRIAVWNVASGHLSRDWAVDASTYGGGVTVENQVHSLALLDGGRQLAVSVSWGEDTGRQHDRITIVRTSDDKILAQRDLPPARRFEGIFGASLTAVGRLVVADQSVGLTGHRLFVFKAE